MRFSLSLRSSVSFAVILAAVAFCSIAASAQANPVVRETPTPNTSTNRNNDEQLDERTPSIRETLTRMQIARQNKEHKQMIERGEEAKKLAAEIERSFSENGKLGRDDISRLNEVEKLVKRVRKDLGADDDEKDNTESSDISRLSPGDIVKNLSDTTARLYEELKKTTRFSISAAAITTSNAALRAARFLKLTR